MKAMNQMRVARSLGAAVPDVRRAPGAGGSCLAAWRAASVPAGPIRPPSVNFLSGPRAVRARSALDGPQTAARLRMRAPCNGRLKE